MSNFPLLEKDSQMGYTCIPWWIAEIAYKDYVRRFGSSQSLKQIAQRGGFSPDEMDIFYPSWRKHVDESSLND